jgi:hypothetical protein
VVLLLERALVSWSSAIDERSELKDLIGSDRRSVISYIHGRMLLYCSSLALPKPFLFSDLSIYRLPDSFIAQSRVVTLRPMAQQVAMRWLKPYTTSRVIIASSS